MKATPIQHNPPENPQQDFISKVDARGQIILPAEVQQLLGVQPDDAIHLRVTGSHVELLPPTLTLEAAFGAVKPRTRPEDFRELRRLARDERLPTPVSK